MQTPSLVLVRCALATASLGLSLTACGSNAEIAGGRPSFGPSAAGGTGGTAGDGGLGGGPQEEPVLERLTLEPATATLTSHNGSKPEVTLVPIGHDTLGASAPMSPSGFHWTVSPANLGQISDGTGVFVASGLIGGEVTVRATHRDAPSLTATATLTVRLEVELLGPDVPADAATRFGTLVEDAAAEADLVYPLDGAVMPQNAYPAEVQWTRAAPDDLFRVVLTKPSLSVVAYVAASPGFSKSWLVETAAWRSLAQSEPDAAAQFRVDRWTAATGTAIRGAAEHKVVFAKAALTGSVYYWELLVSGRIRRIDDGMGVAADFMPSPPKGRDGEACVGCHSVSNSGRYMAGRLGGGDNIGTVFDLTVDLTGNPAPSVWPPSNGLTWWDSSWSPADDRLIVAWQASEPGRRLKLYEPVAGVEVPFQGQLPQGIQPSWSPDGREIAYIANPNSWGGVMTTGDVARVKVTGQDSFGDSRVLHEGSTLQGATEGGETDSYPTWTPSSTHIAFAHGTGARSDWNVKDNQGYHSGLYLMARDGSGLVRLDAAAGGASNTEAFQPRFSPFDSGGYYWMTFLSRRDYGNAERGTLGTRRQQIWVAAIKKNAAPGKDPSQVPYWLPGQSPAAKNISAFWAPRPCRPDGAGCAVNSECCGGDCRQDAEGALVCAAPPPERCRALNETCGSAADCCDERECVNHVCADVPPS